MFLRLLSRHLLLQKCHLVPLLFFIQSRGISHYMRYCLLWMIIDTIMTSSSPNCFFTHLYPFPFYRKDGREFYIPVETSDDDAELTLLWQQFWSTIELCSVTVSPLFLVLVLSLYAASLVTNSQVIASIGLVYVFLFLTIMGSYFFAIVPFILASNTIGNILTPGGTGSGSSQKVSTRLFLLLLLMAVAAGSSKYGYLGF